MGEFIRFSVTELSLWSLSYEGGDWDPFLGATGLLSGSLKKGYLNQDNRAVSSERGGRNEPTLRRMKKREKIGEK